MKKKLLSLVIFVVAICMSLIGAGITYVSAAESTEIEANSANYFDNVNRSVKLREETVSLYIKEPLNTTTKNSPFTARTLREFLSTRKDC